MIASSGGGGSRSAIASSGGRCRGRSPASRSAIASSGSHRRGALATIASSGSRGSRGTIASGGGRCGGRSPASSRAVASSGSHRRGALATIASAASRPPPQPKQGQVIGLGGPGGKDDFIRVRPNQPGHLPRRVRHRPPRLPAQRVVCRVRIGKDFPIIGLHRRQHRRGNGGGGLVVKVEGVVDFHWKFRELARDGRGGGPPYDSDVSTK